jgi:hypothetical protein
MTDGWLFCTALSNVKVHSAHAKLALPCHEKTISIFVNEQKQIQ